MPDTQVASEEKSIVISESAARRIGELVAQEGDEALVLRVAVSGGGCSGFQYGFNLDTEPKDDDLVFERGGVRVVIDSVSIDFLKGSELDFVEDLIGSYFAMKNPNASSTCGCGSSFAV